PVIPPPSGPFPPDDDLPQPANKPIHTSAARFRVVLSIFAPISLASMPTSGPILRPSVDERHKPFLSARRRLNGGSHGPGSRLRKDDDVEAGPRNVIGLRQAEARFRPRGLGNGHRI